ncbi:MAG: hypothetical protein Q9162_004333 [Coniocarpon cinnabarinum]
MLAISRAPRSHLFFSTTRLARTVSTLPTSPHIYVHNNPENSKSYLLSLLPSAPPKSDIAIASSTANPPTPDSTTENPTFLDLLHDTIAEYAHEDPSVKAQAAAFASQGGAGLGSGGALFRGQQRKGTSAQDKRTRRGVTDTIGTSTSSPTARPATHPTSGSPGGGAKPVPPGQSGAGSGSVQGGMGSGGASGFIHVSDERNPPDWGRVAWPEDIFGSLEVTGNGEFVDGTGRYQRSGTYRTVTRDGVLGLSKYLREKVKARVEELESKMSR